jgi:hypothetical protein
VNNDWKIADDGLGVGVSDGAVEMRTVAFTRWFPRYGDPVTSMEKFVHSLVKTVAWLPVYTAIVVTLTLLVLIFGVPFLGGN